MSETPKPITLLPDASTARYWIDTARKLKEGASPDRLRIGLDVAYDHMVAAYEEIDRLRASALNWVTVTDDLATLPDQDSERDVLVDTVRWDDGEPSEMRTYYVLHLETDSADNLTPGDRWSYIPQPKEVDNG